MSKARISNKITILETLTASDTTITKDIIHSETFGNLGSNYEVSGLSIASDTTSNSGFLNGQPAYIQAQKSTIVAGLPSIVNAKIIAIKNTGLHFISQTAEPKITSTDYVTVRMIKDSAGNSIYGNDAVSACAVGGALTDGQELTLTDTLGTSHTFHFDTSVTTVDGTQESGKTLIGLSGAGSNTDRAARIVSAVNAQTVVSITAASIGSAISLTQDYGGIIGNTAVDASAITNFTAGNFAGGFGPSRGKEPVVAILAPGDMIILPIGRANGNADAFGIHATDITGTSAGGSSGNTAIKLYSIA